MIGPIRSGIGWLLIDLGKRSISLGARIMGGTADIDQEVTYGKDL